LEYCIKLIMGHGLREGVVDEVSPEGVRILDTEEADEVQIAGYCLLELCGECFEGHLEL
jgi:hypothetical protein